MLLKASGYESVEVFQKEYLQAKRDVKDYRGELELYQEMRNQKIEILLQEVGDEPKSFLEKVQPYVEIRKWEIREKKSRKRVERER